MMDGQTLHGLLKDHPKEIIMDDSYIEGVVLPSVTSYLKEYRKVVEAIIGVLEEKIKMTNNGALCEDSVTCIDFQHTCPSCYRKVIEKLEDTLTEI